MIQGRSKRSAREAANRACAERINNNGRNVKSKYGFTVEDFEDLVAVRFSHGQLLKFREQIRGAETPALGRSRFADQQNDSAMFGHGQRLMRQQSIENLRLLAGEIPRGYFLHVR
jgi:hypothetical protein